MPDSDAELIAALAGAMSNDNGLEVRELAVRGAASLTAAAGREEKLRELLVAVGNPHSHRTPGAWDADNELLAEASCDWCARWAAALAAAPSPPDRA